MGFRALSRLGRSQQTPALGRAGRVSAVERPGPPAAASASQQLLGPERACAAGTSADTGAVEQIEAGASTPMPPPKERLIAVDFARTFALLGMMAVHLNLGYLHDGGPFTPLSWSGGYSAGGFAVLAGASLSLAARPTESWLSAWLRGLFRGLALFALGIVLAFHSGSVIVILCVYGALFVIAVPFRKVSTRVLAGIGLAMVFVNPVISFLVRHALEDSSVTGSHYALSWDLITGGRPVRVVLQTLILDGEYPLTTWLPLALLGWAAHKAGWLERRAWRRLAALSACTAVLAFGGSWAIESVTHVRADLVDAAQQQLRNAAPTEVGPELAKQRQTLIDVLVDDGWTQREAIGAVIPNTSRGHAAILVDGGSGVPPGDDWEGLLVAGHHTGTTLEMLQILAVTGAFIAGGWALLEVAAPLALFLSWPGRMSLSLYVGHLLLANRVRHFEWLSWVDSRAEGFAQLMLWWALAFLAGAIWRHRRGPLEWLMHRWVRLGAVLAARIEGRCPRATR